jgi:hypothetical protein
MAKGSRYRVEATQITQQDLENLKLEAVRVRPGRP